MAVAPALSLLCRRLLFLLFRPLSTRLALVLVGRPEGGSEVPTTSTPYGLLVLAGQAQTSPGLQGPDGSLGLAGDSRWCKGGASGRSSRRPQAKTTQGTAPQGKSLVRRCLGRLKASRANSPLLRTSDQRSTGAATADGGSGGLANVGRGRSRSRKVPKERPAAAGAPSYTCAGDIGSRRRQVDILAPDGCMCGLYRVPEGCLRACCMR